MGRALIKQPNGKYMLWSSIVDGPIKINMTEEDYINFKMEEAKEKAKETINNYTRDSEYLLDELLFTYDMCYEEKCKLYNDLLLASYEDKDIKEPIFGQLPTKCGDS